MFSENLDNRVLLSESSRALAGLSLDAMVNDWNGENLRRTSAQHAARDMRDQRDVIGSPLASRINMQVYGTTCWFSHVATDNRKSVFLDIITLLYRVITRNVVREPKSSVVSSTLRSKISKSRIFHFESEIFTFLVFHYVIGCYQSDVGHILPDLLTTIGKVGSRIDDVRRGRRVSIRTRDRLSFHLSQTRVVSDTCRLIR